MCGDRGSVLNRVTKKGLPDMMLFDKSLEDMQNIWGKNILTGGKNNSKEGVRTSLAAQ